MYPARERLRPGADNAHTALNTASCSLPGPGAPISPTELNLGDLELLHQWITSTCIGPGQLPEVTAHVQKTIVPLGQAYPFVMRGILAMAATHLGRLRPERQSHYIMLAAMNHDISLPEFQSALQHISAENCLAVISYSKCLLWCSIVGNGSSKSTITISETKTSWLPQWFDLLRGSCLIVESCRAWIKGGPHVMPRLGATVDCAANSDDAHIRTLISDLQVLPECSSWMTVFDSLRDAFALASMRHLNTPTRNAINYWIGSLSDDHIKSLQEKEPWALVALAHFCVLLDRLETESFPDGHAKKLMLIITESLDVHWKRYIRWPCEEIGFAFY